MQDESEELSSDDGNIRYFVGNEDISNKDDSRAQVEAEAAATLSTKFNPEYVERVKSEAEESDDELGQDRFEVEIAATSPTKVNPALIRGVKRSRRLRSEVVRGSIQWMQVRSPPAYLHLRAQMPRESHSKLHT
jgi:hypothetical protein